MNSRLCVFNARLVDPASGTDAPGGLIVENGVISDVGPHLARPTGMERDMVDGRGLVLSPGLVDLRVKTGEPGAEQNETLATASVAAAAGGVTSFVVMPDTHPAIDNVAMVDFIQRRARDTACVRVYAAGGATTGLLGQRMSEIGLMGEAGAALFTNGDQAIDDAGVLRRLLLYASRGPQLVSSRPDTHSLTRGTVMHNGEFAARLGLRGAPREAEWIAIQRDLLLAEATGARLLIDTISTGRSLAMIEEARARGVKVYCTVAAYSLFFNELDVGDYLTYCKVFPPFRPEADRLALIDGLKRGAIDAVVSAHDPQPPENKRLPISEAAYGAIGLETVLSAVMALVVEGALPLLDALRPLTSSPADLINRPEGRLAKGAPADFILFDPSRPWACRREDLHSRSKNSPFDGRRLVGQVMQTWVAGRSVFTRN